MFKELPVVFVVVVCGVNRQNVVEDTYRPNSLWEVHPVYACSLTSYKYDSNSFCPCMVSNSAELIRTPSNRSTSESSSRWVQRCTCFSFICSFVCFLRVFVEWEWFFFWVSWMSEWSFTEWKMGTSEFSDVSDTIDIECYFLKRVIGYVLI